MDADDYYGFAANYDVENSANLLNAYERPAMLSLAATCAVDRSSTRAADPGRWRRPCLLGALTSPVSTAVRR